MLERGGGADEVRMSEAKMRDELVTMLSDGPTATSLAWVFERLLRHPEKLDRLRAEVLQGEREDYVDAVVKETLRLCPAVPLVMRRLMQPLQIAGYTIPADTIVAPCVHLMHRRADVYPEPLSFKPERFLENPEGTYTWIPFGGGVRRCVAASFAQLEMKRVIQVGRARARPAHGRCRRRGRDAQLRVVCARRRRQGDRHAPRLRRARRVDARRLSALSGESPTRLG